jgi:asparaginyl-tRNA synthetase
VDKHLQVCTPSPRLTPGLQSLYIDEKSGSDTTGNGTESSPFATPLAAYQSLHPEPTADANPTSIANFLIRKQDSNERKEYVEISTSAKKRLVKGIELWRKKEVKKAQEGDKVEKERLEMEEREKKRREEASGVVLLDDSSKESKKVYKLCVTLRVDEIIWCFWDDWFES